MTERQAVAEQLIRRMLATRRRMFWLRRPTQWRTGPLHTGPGPTTATTNVRPRRTR